MSHWLLGPLLCCCARTAFQGKCTQWLSVMAYSRLCLFCKQLPKQHRCRCTVHYVLAAVSTAVGTAHGVDAVDAWLLAVLTQIALEFDRASAASATVSTSSLMLRACGARQQQYRTVQHNSSSSTELSSKRSAEVGSHSSYSC